MRSVLLAFVYGALTLVSSLWVTAAGALGCLETCSGADGWANQTDAWQWDALFVLGLLSTVLGFTALLLLFFSKRRAGMLALGLHALAFGLAVGLLNAGGVGSALEVVGWMLVVASGTGLAWDRRRQEV